MFYVKIRCFASIFREGQSTLILCNMLVIKELINWQMLEEFVLSYLFPEVTTKLFCKQSDDVKDHL